MWIASTTVLPTTETPSVMLSRARLSRLRGVGAKCSVAIWPVSLRFISSGERRVLVIGAQAGLYMPDRYFMIKRGKRACERRRGVSMHQHHIGLRLLEHIIQPMQAFLCNQCQRLPRLHDVKVIIRLDLKKYPAPDPASRGAAR